MSNLMDMLFGCSHKNYSFPITAKMGSRRPSAAQATGTYVVCLDCGKEFGYDWKAMRVVAPSREKRYANSPANDPAESFADGKAA